MATSVTTTYAGQFAGEYIADALFSGVTLDSNAITIKPNIAYKEVVKKAALSGIVANATCDFTDAGSLTLTERILEPKRLQVNHTLCKADFIPDWESVEMGFSQFKNMPPKLSDWLIGRYSATVANVTETSIWSGTAGAGDFDGFVTLMTADATVIDVVAAAVTSANVVAELQKIVDDIPTAVSKTDDVMIYISENIYRAYVASLGGFGASGLGANGYEGRGSNQDLGNDLYFNGFKLFRTNGLDDNTAVAAQKSNLWFGTGLLADHNTVKLLDMEDLNGSENVRFIMKYSAGVQYGIGSEIVLYS